MENAIALWIQAIAVVVAIATGIVAIALGVVDRRNARRIAAQDRTFARLAVERELLSRLLENYNRGGSTDSDESARMGAEALTLIGLIGERRLPDLWDSHVAGERQLLLLLDDPEMPDWKKDAIRVQIATLRNQAELDAVMDSGK